MPSSYTEVGAAVARAMASTITATLDDYGLQQPGIGPTTLTGTGPALADACEGLVWVRVGAVFPTDGSSQPLPGARPSWDVPAWCFPMEIGFLWCHQNITEDGGYIEPDQEADYADRDGAYRLALLDAIAYRWRPKAPDPLAQVVMGQRLDAWQPLGPDGGFSGGWLAAYVVASNLAIC